jgi:hypothetical protein
MAGTLTLHNKPVLLTNSMKTFMGEAELKMGQALKIPAGLTCGIPQVLTLHDMKRQFVMVGIVESVANELPSLPHDAKVALAPKLMSILKTDLPAPAPAPAH